MAEFKSRQGATSPTHGWRERLEVWRESHLLFARQAARRLLGTPLSTAATLAMLAIAIAVPLLFQVGVNNLKQLSGHSDAGLELAVFLKPAFSEPPAELLAWLDGQQLELQHSFISRQQALQELAAMAGGQSAELARSLPENPLPATIRIVLTRQPDLTGTADELASALRSRPEVEAVRFDREWFQRAEALVNFAAKLQLATALLLGAGVVLVIGNSVRVAIESRREEILVAKLVGATHAYARRPFLYLGTWLGCGGAVLAIALTGICLLALAYYIEPLEKAFGQDLGLQGLAAREAFLAIAGSALLGWTGAWMACAQQLRRIQPS